MIISISGAPGSGKTSVSHTLSQKLGFPAYSIGGLRAKIALEKGLTVDELNAIGERDRSTDGLVDEYQKRLGREHDHFIIEGRLSWYFIPHAFKIFLACEETEAAKRVFGAHRHPRKDDRADEKNYVSVKDARHILARRVASDVKRYQKYYGVDYRDPTHYDLIIDTTYLRGPEETAKKILESIRQKNLCL